MGHAQGDTVLQQGRGVVRVNRLEPRGDGPERLEMQHPFRYFNSSPEIIRLAVMMYIRFPLSLRQVEDLLSRA